MPAGMVIVMVRVRADGACAAAFRARLLDDLPFPVAAGAGGGDGEEARVPAHLPRAAAGGAELSPAALVRAGALAGFAALGTRVGDLLLRAECGLEEGDLHVVAKVGAALPAAASRRAPPRAPAPEEGIEDPAHVPEDVLEALEDRGEVLGRRLTHAAQAGETVLVVRLALAVIREDFVRLGGLLELLFGVLVLRVPVRMVLDGELPVGFLYLLP